MRWTGHRSRRSVDRSAASSVVARSSAPGRSSVASRSTINRVTRPFTSTSAPGSTVRATTPGSRTAGDRTPSTKPTGGAINVSLADPPASGDHTGCHTSSTSADTRQDSLRSWRSTGLVPEAVNARRTSVPLIISASSVTTLTGWGRAASMASDSNNSAAGSAGSCSAVVSSRRPFDAVTTGPLRPRRITGAATRSAVTEVAWAARASDSSTRRDRRGSARTGAPPAAPGSAPVDPRSPTALARVGQRVPQGHVFASVLNGSSSVFFRVALNLPRMPVR